MDNQSDEYNRFEKGNRSPWKIFGSASSKPIDLLAWIVNLWIPKGKLTLLIGSPNVGKTTLAIAIGAAYTQGENCELWMGQTPSGKGKVVISSTEEDFFDSIKPKVIASGGDPDMFFNLNGIPDGHPTIPYFMRPCTFSYKDNAIWLEEAKRYKDIGLLIFDPASQVIRGNSNNAKDREGYENLGKFASYLDCGIIGIGHTPKTTKGKDIFARIAGSGAVGQVARSIMMACKIKGGPLEDGATHVLVLIKAFGEPVNYGVTYNIASSTVVESGISHHTSKIVWHGTIPGSPEELLKWAESDKEVDDCGKAEEAEDFINKTLNNGPVLWIDIERLYLEAGIKYGTLMRAKNELKIICDKEKGTNRSIWNLPSTDAE
jgi:hypothetical protein